MDIQAEKLALMKLILETKNTRIIESIKGIFEKETKKDIWDHLSADEQKEIKEGMDQIENGEVVSWEEFLSKHS